MNQRATGATASVDFNLNAANTATFTSIARLETRASAAVPAEIDPGGNPIAPAGNQDGPSVRTAIHSSGVVYAVFFGWRVFAPAIETDIVVCREDNWGLSALPFSNLTDPGDGKAGFRVATGVSVAPLGTNLGTQRIGSNLAIAVDPRNSQRVYIAWCDGLATAASPYTLRVRRSDNGGKNWTGDLYTTGNATNPGLAVNSQGTVALLYQQLADVSGTKYWRTHLVSSTDYFATIATDMTLADQVDSDLGAQTTVVIGDYINLVAVGRDFYGTFSCQNLPLLASFPVGVRYLRNVDNFGQATGRLLAADNVTPVWYSVDPFFFHYYTVEPQDDFYVRDWTDSPLSGDDGSEPSIKPLFYVTSDVWNRRGTLPGAFPNDQPENEDAGNGPGTFGANWLFARIRRRAAAQAGYPDWDVWAHFLVSKLGVGSNFVDATDADPDVSISAPDPIVRFSAAEVGPKTTAPLFWHLSAVASTHLCVAVEITTGNDPFANVSLHGRAPGWPWQDIEIVNDNNKAQRNMGLTIIPARGAGLSLSAAFGIVHNAATFPRDILIRYTVPHEMRRSMQIEIEVPEQARIRARESGTIVLAGVQPGENRWIGARFRPPIGKKSEILTIFFDEIVNGSAVNGFGLGIQLGSAREASIHTLNRHLSVFMRLAAGWKMRSAETQVELAQKALKALKSLRSSVPPVAWLNEVRKNAPFFDEVKELIGRPDPFGVQREAASLRRLLDGKKRLDALVSLTSYLERIDSHLTMLQLRNGDRADVLQNVRWQRDLLSRLDNHGSEARRRIDELCGEFIRAWEGRKASARDYPGLMQRVHPQLEKLAGELQNKQLKSSLSLLAGGGREPEILQRLHREALLQLQAHVGRAGVTAASRETRRR
jgi:hypothetical protein